MSGATPRPSSGSGFVTATMRVFELSLGQILWSRRTIFMAVIAAAPVLLAVAIRVAQSAGVPAFRLNGLRVDGAGMFGLIVWLLFVRFLVPVLGVFYGTALIADEVEDRTVTYLFTRPVRRAAVLVGKYVAYLVCTASVVLPAVVVVFFLLVPFTAIPGAALPFAKDVGILALGLAAYGALFALAGTMLKRPLVVGLIFAFGWEQIALMMPGYLKRLTLAYYLQGLVPHAMPAGDAGVLLPAGMPAATPPAVSLLWLVLVTVAAVVLAARAVERREYVLDQ